MTTHNQDTTALFHALLKDPHHHARFLNTLSLMELCGAQKLSRMLPSQPRSSFLLEHIAEEYRHAFFLRHLANKVAPASIEDYNPETVWCLNHSKRYINSIERTICLMLHRDGHETHSSWVYLLSTLAIELRALPFYTLYQAALDEHQLGISVKSVISEEEHHLLEIQQRIKTALMPSGLVNAALEIEHTEFARWIKALSKEVLLFA